MAHFNRLRTFGMTQAAFTADVNWEIFRACLKRCSELWGQPAKRKFALYSPNCMSGSGLPAVGEDYWDRFPYHFRIMMESTCFQQACAIIDAGVSTTESAQELRSELRSMRRVVPGMLGDYHFKMVLDFITAARWLPPRFARDWPVCKQGGTAWGLKCIFPSAANASPRVLSSQLNMLTDRVALESKSWRAGSDHVGLVGAQLCWLKRLGGEARSGGHDNRFRETTETWETELRDLREAGVTKFW